MIVSKTLFYVNKSIQFTRLKVSPILPLPFKHYSVSTECKTVKLRQDISQYEQTMLKRDCLSSHSWPIKNQLSPFSIWAKHLKYIKINRIENTTTLFFLKTQCYKTFICKLQLSDMHILLTECSRDYSCIILVSKLIMYTTLYFEYENIVMPT